MAHFVGAALALLIIPTIAGMFDADGGGFWLPFTVTLAFELALVLTIATIFFSVGMAVTGLWPWDAGFFR